MCICPLGSGQEKIVRFLFYRTDCASGRGWMESCCAARGRLPYQAGWLLPAQFSVWFSPWLTAWYCLTTKIWPTISSLRIPVFSLPFLPWLRFHLILVTQSCRPWQALFNLLRVWVFPGSCIGQVFNTWWEKVWANLYYSTGKVRIASNSTPSCPFRGSEGQLSTKEMQEIWPIRKGCQL